MRRCHLVDQEVTEDGVMYRASDEAAGYVELLETPYSERLKDCAAWLAGQVRSTDKVAFKAFVRDSIGDWTEAFSTVGGNSVQG